MKRHWIATGMMALALVASPAQSQGRLSLSERVSRLEAEAAKQNTDASIDLLNRLNELQAEVQALRGLVEQQQFQLEEAKNRNRDLYVDLDSRLARLEGNPAAINTPSVAPALGDGQTQDMGSPPPVPPSDPNQLAMEPLPDRAVHPRRIRRCRRRQHRSTRASTRSPCRRRLHRHRLLAWTPR
ncbi:MAG: hypothetical protein IPK97_12915 [Ahniella sp.]|nr:hypothetical protein [Ahniella sp.]